MNTLVAYVHVTHPDGGSVELAPGKPVPDWALPLISNPKAWAGGVVPEVSGEPEPPHPPPTSTGDDTVPDPVKIPPRRGTGSGRDAWAAYAAANGIEVTDDLKSRDDIIAALELVGIPVE